MFAFFMSHIYLEKHRGDLSLQAMEKLHRVFPTSLHVLTQVNSITVFLLEFYLDFRSVLHITHNGYMTKLRNALK
jgi:hypothetical protein